jgi:hypothetical protein
VNDGFVAADCTTDGTHDVIVRCKQCDEVLSTDTVVDEQSSGTSGRLEGHEEATTDSGWRRGAGMHRCDEKETSCVEPIPVEKAR